jgi:hypothetical protein
MKRCNLGCQQSNENLSGLLTYTEEIREERSWIGRKANLQFKAKFPDPRRRTEKSSARCLLESGPDSAGKARKERICHKRFQIRQIFHWFVLQKVQHQSYRGQLSHELSSIFLRSTSI